VRIIIPILFAGFLLGCTETKFNTIGDIEYKRFGEECLDTNLTHWLIDIEARNAKDSVYLNTKKLGRKVEFVANAANIGSDLYKILEQTCSSDSVKVRCSARDFYQAFNGSVPSYLSPGEKISCTIYFSDKLSSKSYVAHKLGFESELITKYLKKSNWNTKYDSLTGIYYETLKQSANARTEFKKAKFKYLIKSINDKIIAYSKDNDPLVYDVNDRSILLGIQELSRKMSEGESLRAVVPSTQAFGPIGNSKVTGYMPIIIELELSEIIE